MTAVSETQAVIATPTDVPASVRIDDATVVEEVTAAFSRYETALIAGDLDVLAELFWDSETTRRFGVADTQMGAEALGRWRAEQPPLPAGRELFDTVATTFDARSACVTTCFRHPGREMTGRQSQFWIRFPDGWRIVSAQCRRSSIPGQPEVAVRNRRRASGTQTAVMIAHQAIMAGTG
jgi:hypothetical protein